MHRLEILHYRRVRVAERNRAKSIRRLVRIRMRQPHIVQSSEFVELLTGDPDRGKTYTNNTKRTRKKETFWFPTITRNV